MSTRVASCGGEKAGIGNIRFLESDFAELLDTCAGEAPYDYITLHGVWSWVSPEMRAAIVAFLRRHLAPGGLVYVSYNALPGWSEGMAVKRLLHDAAGLVRERSDHAVRRAAGMLERAREAGSPFLRDNKIANTVLDLARTGNVSYLAHEYLNASWEPFYHADVAGTLAEAKLSYVGSARLVENYPTLHLTEEQRALCDEIAVPSVRETMKDFFFDRRFRKDVYVRGARRLTPARQDTLLRAIEIASLLPREMANLRLDVGLGEANLDSATYDPILDALEQRPHSIGELSEMSRERGSSAKPNEIAGLLTGTGQVWPVAPDHGKASGEAARRFNRVQAEAIMSEDASRRTCIAAPLIGVGISGTTIDLVAYNCILAGNGTVDAIAQAVWQPIAARGEQLMHDGAPVEGETASLNILRERAQAVLDTALPMWRRLGAI